MLIKKLGILYIVATPIGNLSDITLRALETLKKVDIIACEDTRVTIKLLNHYNIKKPLISFHQHSRLDRLDSIIDKLTEGKDVALVTDAGTPGISDPGGKLVQEALNREVEIVSIPGPSALIALASVAGINMSKFIFMGFAPHKKGRETFFREVAESKIPAAYFDSPHRLIKNLEMLAQFSPEKKVVVGRELTKIFEEIKRGSVKEMADYYSKKTQIKGEITVLAH